jgi:FkbM family methyltransferase
MPSIYLEIDQTVSQGIGGKRRGSTNMSEKTQGFLVETIYNGIPVFFFGTDETDVIQRYHAAGVFYELEELSIISRFFQRGGVFADIGANSGNHTVFVARFLHPKQVIAFEPNPVASRLLKVNIALNGLRDIVDISNLGIGLSDAPGKAIAQIPSGNLGGTFMLEAENGALRLAPGDDLMGGRKIDFIKIDVEGMEMHVLRGLRRAISMRRPRIFIEVFQENQDTLNKWNAENEYNIVDEFQRYSGLTNFMMLPVEQI